MADTVSTQVLFNNAERTIRKFTNVSDGTGESDVVKVDISTLSGTPTAVRIMKVWYAVAGAAVTIEFDHTADDVALVLQGSGFLDFNDPVNGGGGIPDPRSAGGTGDILFTTNSATAGDSYTIILELQLEG